MLTGRKRYLPPLATLRTPPFPPLGGNLTNRGWARQSPTGLGGEAWPPGGEAPARDG